ncbi:MAG: glycosyltransferase [Polyangiales bacterium]
MIASTVRALLRGRYANLEVLVVDDGSTDDTAAVVEDLARTDPRVRCPRRRNGGKARAANAGCARRGARSWWPSTPTRWCRRARSRAWWRTSPTPG